jgi:hypothetical protein
MEELNLKCQSSTQLHVLFGEAWLVQTSHVRLKGMVPYDRCACISGQHTKGWRSTVLLSCIQCVLWVSM